MRLLIEHWILWLLLLLWLLWLFKLIRCRQIVGMSEISLLGLLRRVLLRLLRRILLRLSKSTVELILLIIIRRHFLNTDVNIQIIRLSVWIVVSWDKDRNLLLLATIVSAVAAIASIIAAIRTGIMSN